MAALHHRNDRERALSPQGDSPPAVSWKGQGKILLRELEQLGWGWSHGGGWRL